jgi:hypothetical protein
MLLLLELIDSQDVWCLINSLSLSFVGFLLAENVMSDQNFHHGLMGEDQERPSGRWMTAPQ